MLIERFLDSKRAISPILATLLLIVIAVAAIVVTYAWITTYMGNAASQEVMLYKENARFATGETEITIGNSGTSDTRIVRVWLGDSSGNMTDVTGATSITGSGTLLAAGGSAKITIYWPNGVDDAWLSGQNYYFKIIPNIGQFLEFQEQALQQ